MGRIPTDEPHDEPTALEFAEARVRSEGRRGKLAAHYSAKEIVEIAALPGIMALA